MTNSSRNRPAVIKLGDEEHVLQVAAGYYHTYVINGSGAFYFMEYNDYGVVGNGTTFKRHITTLIKLCDEENVVQVAAVQLNTCVINSSGALYFMGCNAYGKLGDETTTQRKIPTLIKLVDEENVVQVAAGYVHICDKQQWCIVLYGIHWLWSSRGRENFQQTHHDPH